MTTFKRWLVDHAADWLTVEGFLFGYLFGLVAPAPAVEIALAGGTVYLLARLLERRGGWAP